METALVRQGGHMEQKAEVKDLAHRKEASVIYIPSQEDWNFMLTWGASAIKSRMLPSSITTPEAAAIIILKGRELGLTFMTAISHIHVINGKPTMSAELIQGLARKNLPGLLINILESDSKIAKIEFKRPEFGSKSFIQAFTIEEATAAKLTGKDVWKSYPAAMLWSRCVTAGLRKVCPEALMGISYTPEEMGAEVDQDGNIIETTGRHVQASPAKLQPVENPKPDIEPKPQPPIDPDLAAKRTEGHRIKELKTELGITDDELKQEVFRLCGTDSFLSLTLAQMTQVRKMLEQESASRKTEQPLTQDDSWMQQTMGPLGAESKS